MGGELLVLAILTTCVGGVGYVVGKVVHQHWYTPPKPPAQFIIRNELLYLARYTSQSYHIFYRHARRQARAYQQQGWLRWAGAKLLSLLSAGLVQGIVWMEELLYYVVVFLFWALTWVL